MQFTCWGVSRANDGGKENDKNSLNILRGLNVIERVEVVRSVRRIGFFHTVEPTGEAFR